MFSFVPWILWYQNKITQMHNFSMKPLPLPLNLKHEIQSSPIELKKIKSINYAEKIQSIMSILTRRFRKKKRFIQCDVTFWIQEISFVDLAWEKNSIFFSHLNDSKVMICKSNCVDVAWDKLFNKNSHVNDSKVMIWNSFLKKFQYGIFVTFNNIH